MNILREIWAVLLVIFGAGGLLYTIGIIGEGAIWPLMALLAVLVLVGLFVG